MKPERFFLFTWPMSQAFICHKDARLVLPPEDDIDGALDSAYLVPVKTAGELAARLEEEGTPIPLPDDVFILSTEDCPTEETDILDMDGNRYNKYEFENTPSYLSEFLSVVPRESPYATDPEVRVVVEDENGQTVPVTAVWYDKESGTVRLSIDKEFKD